MQLIIEQFPIVIRSLNIGFLQTLKLFFVTLIGAFPLGLLIAFGSMSHFKPLKYLSRFVVWIIRGTPLMIQLLIIYYFPGLILHTPIWGSGESGRFLAASVSFILNYACYFSEIYRGGTFQKRLPCPDDFLQCDNAGKGSVLYQGDDFIGHWRNNSFYHLQQLDFKKNLCFCHAEHKPCLGLPDGNGLDAAAVYF